MGAGIESHEDHPKEYWRYEYDVAARYMAPLLREWGVVLRDADVIDVGCGEGGGVCSFHDLGARCVGFDVDAQRIAVAQQLQEDRGMPLMLGSLYDDPLPFGDRQFDLVVLHDVFEHLDNKADMLERLRQYCKPSGKLLITFPPYYSPYGAHQQHLRSTFGKLPFFHLLPLSISAVLPRMKKEHPHVIEEVRKLGTHKMGMRKFERLAQKTGMSIVGKQAYLISPNHIRFGLKPIPAGPLADVPLLSEIACTGVVYLLGTS